MKLALFDFDGTITRHDSFLLFALFAKGKMGLLKALSLSAPKLLCWKLHLCSPEKAKASLFKNLYRSMHIDIFRRYCKDFVHIIERDLNPVAINELENHKNQGHHVAIVSASIAQWIAPWAETHGITHVIATEIEIDCDGKLTGNFIGRNCNGAEKAARVKKAFPGIAPMEIWAYGNSSDDDQMLAMAMHSFKVSKGEIIPVGDQSVEAAQ